MQGRNRFFVPGFDEQIAPRIEIGYWQMHSIRNDQAPLATHQHLLLTHPPIQSVLPNQFLMGSHLHNPAFIQYHYFICSRDSRQSMGNNERRLAVCLLKQHILDSFFSERIQCRGGFIKNKDIRIF